MPFFGKKILLFTALLTLGGTFFLVPAAATLQGLHVGVQAPDFTLSNLSGESHSFADLHGQKLTIVIFWSTWSRKSGEALARMEKLYRALRKRGLAVVAVDADEQHLSPEDLTAIRSTVGKLNLDFPVLLDHNLQTFHDYGVIALPSLVVLTPDRTIRYELSGYPLVGSEEMVDFVTDTIEGKSLAPAIAKKTGYQPKAKALDLFNMGRNTLKSKRMAATAEMWFKQAIAADPDFLAPRLNLGEFYLKRKETDKARDQFAQVLQKNPKNVEALCEMGMILARAGKTEKGKALLAKALDLDDSYTPCYYYLGYLSGIEGNMKKASTLFHDAGKLNRMDPNIFIYRGRMFEKRKNSTKAAAAYRKALEMMLPPG
jgi:peroxiredoxin/Tfp pilus assembly protein PilF